jgi:hypothetical protein
METTQASGQVVAWKRSLTLHCLAVQYELIDAAELARRWRVPRSWILDRTRTRTPEAERIPCVRLGRYVRFRWDSPELNDWLDAHLTGKK